MEFLPLYPEPPRSAVETVESLETCSDCRRCFFSGLPDLEVVKKKIKTKKLGEDEAAALIADAVVKKSRVKTVCMSPEGDPGGLLVVTDSPGGDEDRIGRPLCGRPGRYFRQEITKHWDGPIALDNAIKCAPGSMEVRETHVKACRPYLKATIEEVKPKRIIAMGSGAFQVLLGRRPAVYSVRRGYGWYADGMIPIFLLMNPSAARRNPFVQSWFESDLKWACTTSVDKLIRDMPTDGMARIIRTEEDARFAVDDLRQSEWFSWDVETAGLMFNPDFKILCIAMSAKDSEDTWVWTKEALDDPGCFQMFVQLMTDRKVGKIPQNGKYDRLAVAALWGFDVRGNCGDTLFWRKLLDSDADGALDVLQELVGMGGGKDEVKIAITDVLKRCRAKFIGKGKTRRAVTEDDLAKIGPLEHVMAIREGRGRPKAHAYALIPEEVLLRYCGRDAKSTELVAKKLEPRLRRNKEINRVWERLIHPASQAIVQVEKWGVQANVDTIHAFRKRLNMQKEEIEKRFQSYDVNFNPGSARQVAGLLFETLGLPVPKKTKTGQACTDAETLKRLKDKHPIVQDLLDHRMIVKQQGTYADGMLDHVRSDGRIHPSFRLAGTRTGRLSCSEPNLQNITAPYTWYGRMARDIFTIPKGRVMVQLDFSQLELRVAAMISGDKKMKAIFAAGEDYHQKTAETVAPVAWGINAAKAATMNKEDWKPYRKKAKVVNFGLLYGMGDAGLAAKIGSTKQEAGKIRQAVLGSFKTYAAWAEEQVEIARRTSYTWTWWDGQLARRRSLWRIRDADGESRSRAENGASNTPIQGTASDFCLASLVECVRWILETSFPAKLVLTVHDSLMFEVDIDRAEELVRTVLAIMQSWPSEGVPILVDAEIGLSWGSLFSLIEKDGEFLATWEEGEGKNAVTCFAPWQEKVFDMAA